MLTRGNQKLGNWIWAFNLPCKLTCPGMSPTCSALCYACDGRFLRWNVKHAHQRNLIASRLSDFRNRMIDEICNNCVLFLRWHSSGDFYSPGYVASWRHVVQRMRRTTFYGYTRSWTNEEMLPALIELAAEKNVQLWWSCDRSMPQPPRVAGVRLAWMAETDQDLPPYAVDLVFRDDTSAGLLKRLSGYLVCPYEQKLKLPRALTCSQCGLCFKDPVGKHWHDRKLDGLPDTATPTHEHVLAVL